MYNCSELIEFGLMAVSLVVVGKACSMIFGASVRAGHDLYVICT
jgi:hypothetical protein